MIAAVLKTARGYIGYKEAKNNNNIFASIAAHPNFQPWCATFVVAVFKNAGALGAIKNTSSCIEMHKWAKSKKRLVPFTEAKAGDLVLMDFKGTKVPQHIGIASKDFDGKAIECIEGNTGDADQTNGEGVYRKKRPAQFIHSVIRPIYEGAE